MGEKLDIEEAIRDQVILYSGVCSNKVTFLGVQ